MQWPDVLGTLVAGKDLTPAQTRWAMGEILAGAATPAQIAGFVVALRTKGESIEELTGLVEAMYDVMTPISVSGRVLDVVGTGGDRSFSVNISTMSAIVAAGAGARVVKHGNRSASSKSGTADVLEALGVRLDLPADRVAAVAEEAGITFCFAASFHPAMRHAAVPRKELGIGTAFNVLGPLANPVRPAAQAIGCADVRLAPVMAGVFAARGVDAWVFRGDDGLDELTTTTTSQLWVVHDGEVRAETVDPTHYGLAPATTEDLRGGDAAHNAEVVRQLLAGKTGPVREAVEETDLDPQGEHGVGAELVTGAGEAVEVLVLPALELPVRGVPTGELGGDAARCLALRQVVLLAPRQVVLGGLGLLERVREPRQVHHQVVRRGAAAVADVAGRALGEGLDPGGVDPAHGRRGATALPRRAAAGQPSRARGRGPRAWGWAGRPRAPGSRRTTRRTGPPMPSRTARSTRLGPAERARPGLAAAGRSVRKRHDSISSTSTTSARSTMRPSKTIRRASIFSACCMRFRGGATTLAGLSPP